MFRRKIKDKCEICTNAEREYYIAKEKWLAAVHDWKQAEMLRKCWMDTCYKGDRANPNHNDWNSLLHVDVRCLNARDVMTEAYVNLVKRRSDRDQARPANHKWEHQ